MKTATRHVRPRDLRLLRPEALAAVSLLAEGASVRQTADAYGVHPCVVVRLLRCAQYYHRASRLADLRALPDRTPEGIGRYLTDQRRWPR